jgi:hypothetical protein
VTLMTAARHLEKLAADNSPTILTAIGVTGTITTAVLTGKASVKAFTLLQREDPVYDPHNPHDALTAKERVLCVWKLYIPPAVAGVLTVASIITANQIGTRRAAAMAAAYAVSERAFVEYKDKVSEKLGERKEQAIRDEVAQDQVNKNPSEGTHVFSARGGDVLCYEPYTGRYFTSDMETMKKAQNDTNYMVLNNFYASLSDFYDHLGLDRTQMSDDFGWNSDDLLELTFTTTLADNGKPCLVMNYQMSPIRGYSRVQ